METKHNLHRVLEDKQCRCNVILRRVHVTAVAVKNQLSIKYCDCGCIVSICSDSRAAVAALARTTNELALI
jgi:hypothetical protein